MIVNHEACMSCHVHVQAGLLGALGLAGGLILETVLLIIRTNRPKTLEEVRREASDNTLRELPCMWPLNPHPLMSWTCTHDFAAISAPL